MRVKATLRRMKLGHEGDIYYSQKFVVGRARRPAAYAAPEGGSPAGHPPVQRDHLAGDVAPAAALARKTAAPAMSASAPARPIGMRPMMRASRSGSATIGAFMAVGK